ncbi:MAG: efflux RND transporter periplasmic adaptor subunit [Gammaproteobacteria bacterium]
MQKLLLVLLVAAGAGAALWYATREKPVEVRVHALARGEVRATVSNTRVGTVEACQRARMSPAAAGQVSVLNVTEGDTVAAGAVLLEIWNEDRKAELRLAEAEVSAVRARADEACAIAAGARREADRLAKLRKNKLVSEEIADDAATRADSARAACEGAIASTRVSAARIAVAREVLERTRLRAPFAGIVAEVDAKLGEYLTPSPPGIATVPAIDLIDPTCLYITAPIDEVDAPRIRTGMSACVSLDAFTERYCAASVRRIAPYVLEREKQARTVDVEVVIESAADTAALLPGYSADIEVLIEARDDVLRLPTEAVTEGDRVLVVDADSRLVERSFEPGLSNWQYTEVRDGLEAGARVVLSTGRAGVTAGALVIVVDDASGGD